MNRPIDPFEPDPDFWADRLSEPIDRYIRAHGNPQTESEARAMVMAIDPTLDSYEADEQLERDFHFTTAKGLDWEWNMEEDRNSLIVPLAKVLAIDPRGHEASQEDMIKVWIFWHQVVPQVMPDGEQWEFPEGGVEDGKINAYGRAALMHWQAQTSWVLTLAQWMAAYTGKLQRADPRGDVKS